MLPMFCSASRWTIAWTTTTADRTGPTTQARRGKRQTTIKSERSEKDTRRQEARRSFLGVAHPPQRARDKLPDRQKQPTTTRLLAAGRVERLGDGAETGGDALGAHLLGVCRSLGLDELGVGVGSRLDKFALALGQGRN